MKIGAQLYTLRDYLKTPKDIAESLDRVAKIGYKSIQVSGLGPFDPTELSGVASSLGLEIAITHTAPDRILNETKQVAKEHQIMGCSHVGIGMRPDRYADTLDGYRKFLQDFDPAAKALAAEGLKLHYHNHEFEFAKDGGKVLYDVLVDETDPGRWGFIVDTYWVQVGGRCPSEQIKALKGRITAVHLKDLAIVGGKQRMAEVMEGNLSWQEIFLACKTVGVQYAMVEQDDCGGKSPFDALKKSFDNLAAAGYK